jgi:hypothetical protein
VGRVTRGRARGGSPRGTGSGAGAGVRLRSARIVRITPDRRARFQLCVERRARRRRLATVAGDAVLKRTPAAHSSGEPVVLVGDPSVEYAVASAAARVSQSVDVADRLRRRAGLATTASTLGPSTTLVITHGLLVSQWSPPKSHSPAVAIEEDRVEIVLKRTPAGRACLAAFQ